MESQSADHMRRFLNSVGGSSDVVLLFGVVVSGVLGWNGLVRGNKVSRSSQESQLVCLNALASHQLSLAISEQINALQGMSPNFQIQCF